MRFLAEGLVIEAPSWFTAKQYARRWFTEGPEPIVTYVPTKSEDEQPAMIEIVWVGSDYGVKPDRHLEVRERVTGTMGHGLPVVGEWSAWSRL